MPTPTKKSTFKSQVLLYRVRISEARERARKAEENAQELQLFLNDNLCISSPEDEEIHESAYALYCYAKGVKSGFESALRLADEYIHLD